MKITRREALKIGLTGVGGLLLPLNSSNSALAGKICEDLDCPRGEIPPPTFNQVDLSPQIPRFQYPFKRPPLLEPVRSFSKGRKRPLDCYEITMKKAEVQIIPGLKTEIWSYNRKFPGPLIRQRGGFRYQDRGRDSMVRFINRLGTFEENDQQVPINTTVHLHGMASLPQYDGYAEDLICPGQFKD